MTEPLEYNIKTIDVKNIHTLPCNEKVVKRYWYKNPIILDKLVAKQKPNTNIIDIGGGTMNHFPLATHIIDVDTTKDNVYKVDIDFEKLPFDNKFLVLHIVGIPLKIYKIHNFHFKK